MKKRLFALLLVIAMAFALPLTASAADPAGPSAPAEMCQLPDGSLLVSDTWNKVVWKISSDTAEILAGNIAPDDAYGEPIGRYVDGAKADSYFIEPRGIAPFGDDWAVSDAGANVIRLVKADGTVRTLAGSGNTGSADGIGRNVSFDRPFGLAADDDGCVFIADSGNGSIRKIASDGKVTTVVTGLHEPCGLAWSDGVLYIAEMGGNRVLRVKDGVIETLAGILEEAEEEGVFYGGYADGPASRARFDHPEGIAVDEDGTVYVADHFNHAVRAIETLPDDGTRVRTVLRSADTLTFPAEPIALAWDSDSGLVLSDRFTGVVKVIDPAVRIFADAGNGEVEAWYTPYVRDAHIRGIVEGENGLFVPDRTVTAAEFATMLSRVAKSADGTTRIDANETPEGVTADDWFVKEARWTVSSGIVEDGIDWNAPLTRCEIAKMLYLFAESQGYDVSKRADLDAFSDVDDLVTAFGEGTNVANYRNIFQWAVAENIFEGDDGLLKPVAEASRAEAVKVAVAFMDAYGL